MFCLVLPQSAPIANSVFKQTNLGMLHGEVGCWQTVWSLSRDLLGDMQQAEVSFLHHCEVVFTQIINQTVSIRIKNSCNAKCNHAKIFILMEIPDFWCLPVIQKWHCLSSSLQNIQIVHKGLRFDIPLIFLSSLLLLYSCMILWYLTSALK